jgi:chemotaxis protein CheD
MRKASDTEVTAWPVRVKMGEIVIRACDEAPEGLSIRGLGSCVAVFIYDKRQLRVAGMAHVLLPEPILLPRPAERSPLTSPGNYAPTAVAALIDGLMQRGLARRDMAAKLAGGAHMFSFSKPDHESLGERNIRAVLEALDRERISVIGMEVGGSSGRSVLARISTGGMQITSLRREPKEL